MALPPFEALMRPLLVTIDDGSDWRSSDIRASLARQLDLTDDDLTETLAEGGNRFVNLVAWALHHLSRAKLVERRRQSVYRITPRGRQVLVDHPTTVDLDVCKAFDEWHHSKARRRAQRRDESAPQLAGAGRDTAHSAPAYRGRTGSDRRSRAPTVDVDLVAQLERLTDLHATGALSDEEFNLAKSRVLGTTA